MRIYLAKNPKKDIEKQPYFFLKLVKEDSINWETVGALWKSKSGTGYMGTLNEGFSITGSKPATPAWRKETPPAPPKTAPAPAPDEVVEPEFPEAEVIPED